VIGCLLEGFPPGFVEADFLGRKKRRFFSEAALGEEKPEEEPASVDLTIEPRLSKVSMDPRRVSYAEGKRILRRRKDFC